MVVQQRRQRQRQRQRRNIIHHHSPTTCMDSIFAFISGMGRNGTIGPRVLKKKSLMRGTPRLARSSWVAVAAVVILVFLLGTSQQVKTVLRHERVESTRAHHDTQKVVCVQAVVARVIIMAPTQCWEEPTRTGILVYSGRGYSSNNHLRQS